MPTHDRNNLLYVLASREHFESLRRYNPRRSDFHDAVAGHLVPGWNIARTDVWFVCRPPAGSLRPQGWKIHLSATPLNASEVLAAAVPAFVERGTAFKFALDRQILMLMNGKTWSRGGSAKFITAYPANDEQFLELLALLHSRTGHLGGPHILSDRRYQDSSVVHYRYGGFVHDAVVGATGDRTGSIVAPDGKRVPDVRQPYFAPPEWVRDPVEPIPVSDAPAEQPANTLKNGTYEVETALAFRNAGGIYVGRDVVTGRQVLIKEARPDVLLAADGTDAVTLLKREYRLLETIAPHRIAPEPIDLFQDWEHWFLVEEFIGGSSLAQYNAATSPLLTHAPDDADLEAFLRSFQVIFSQLVDHLDVLQSSNIAMLDLSPSNVMVDAETLRVRLIDFEAACECGVDTPVAMETPGFAPSSRWQSAWQPSCDDDRYALGALMLAYVFRINPLLAVDPAAGERFLAEIVADFGFPGELPDLILSLMRDDAAARPTLAAVRQALRDLPVDSCRKPTDASPARAAVVSTPTAESALAYVESVADYARSDRLFPADARVFQTNPLSVAYGACGIAWAFQRVRGAVPSSVLDWIDRQPVDRHAYSSGLYVGLSGIAWALDELGLRRKAETLLSMTADDDRLADSPDLYFGLAGWGLTNLRFFSATHDERYLDRAKEAAERLIGLKQEDEEGTGCYWPGADGYVQLGLAHGSSGIALFLLYLYLVTRDERALAVGRAALAHDLAHGQERDGGLSWARYRHAQRTVYPYWRYGSAGIGTVLLRYCAALGDPAYRPILEKVAVDAERKYTVFSGLLNGLAGIGHFLLDLQAWSQDERYQAAALRLAGGIRLFAIQRPSGIAFPGEGLLRISCDYATGGAGVAVFLDRLANPTKGAPFLLDALIPALSADPDRLAVA